MVALTSPENARVSPTAETRRKVYGVSVIRPLIRTEPVAARVVVSSTHSDSGLRPSTTIRPSDVSAHLPDHFSSMAESPVGAAVSSVGGTPPGSFTVTELLLPEKPVSL